MKKAVTSISLGGGTRDCRGRLGASTTLQTVNLAPKQQLFTGWLVSGARVVMVTGQRSAEADLLAPDDWKVGLFGVRDRREAIEKYLMHSTDHLPTGNVVSNLQTSAKYKQEGKKVLHMCQLTRNPNEIMLQDK